MKIYREVEIVNMINNLEDLINLSIIGHLEASDKNLICIVLQSFVIPKLEQMREKLQEMDSNNE